MRFVLVKVEITGNYNVLVADLKIEFTPSRPVKILTDDEFDGSNDIASFIRSGIIKVTKDVEEIEQHVEEPTVNEDVVEIEPVKDEPRSVVDATDVSKNANTSSKVIDNIDELEDEKLEDSVVDATDASVNSNEKLKVKATEFEPEVVDATDASKNNNGKSSKKKSTKKK